MLLEATRGSRASIPRAAPHYLAFPLLQVWVLHARACPRRPQAHRRELKWRRRRVDAQSRSRSPHTCAVHSWFVAGCRARSSRRVHMDGWTTQRRSAGEVQWPLCSGGAASVPAWRDVCRAVGAAISTQRGGNSSSGGGHNRQCSRRPAGGLDGCWQKRRLSYMRWQDSRRLQPLAGHAVCKQTSSNGGGTGG